MSVLSDLQEEVLAHQFNSSRYGARIYTFFDEAIRQIQRETDMRLQERIVTIGLGSGSTSLTLTSDIARVTEMYYEDSNERILLQKLKPEEYDQLVQLDSVGMPTAFSVWGDSITFIPRTTSAAIDFYLRTYTFPSEISGEGSTVDLHADYYDLLKDYALFRCYVAEHDFQAGDYHKNLFQENLEKMKGQLQYDVNAEPDVVAGTWGS